MKSYAIIMAGGVGARFWPYGSHKLPKQFLPIANSSDTMIQLTVKRIKEIIPMDRIFIVTNAQYAGQVKKQVPRIPVENIIGEPVGRNTAPCAGLAAIILRQFDEKAKMLLVPADHLIEQEDEFQDVINTGLSFIENHDSIVTLGINPTHPETGYGYIQYVDDAFLTVESNVLKKTNIYKVKTFAEKPTLETAKHFLESGDFLWNSGMFISRADVVLNEIKRSLPDLHHELLKVEKNIHTDKFRSALEKAYTNIKSISIDYGIMEKASNVYVIKSHFVWSDLGSWDEVFRIRSKDKNKNVISGESFFVKDSSNNLIMSPDGFVGVIGVEDLIVINTGDGLLICKRGRSQEVKDIVDYLKRKGLTDYL
jgi:mannose-1-phosphate guanylyltransferase